MEGKGGGVEGGDNALKDMFLGEEDSRSRFEWWEGKEMKTWCWRLLVLCSEEVGD